MLRYNKNYKVTEEEKTENIKEPETLGTSDQVGEDS